MKWSGIDLVDHLLQRPAGLPEEEAREIFVHLLTGDLPDVQIGAVLAVLQQRSPSVAERAGMLRAVAETAALPADWMPGLVHISGARRGKQRTFLAAPAAAFVAAAAGVRVVFSGVAAPAQTLNELAAFTALGLEHAGLQQAETLLQGAGVSTLTLEEIHPRLARLLNLPLPEPCTQLLYDLSRLAAPPGAISVMGYVDQSEGKRWAQACAQVAKGQHRAASRLLLQEWEGSADLVPVWPINAILVDAGQTLTLRAPLHDLGLDPSGVAALPAVTSDETAEFTWRILHGSCHSQAHVNAVLLTAALYLHAARTEMSLPVCVAVAREQIASGAAMAQFERMQTWVSALTAPTRASEEWGAAVRVAGD